MRKVTDDEVIRLFVSNNLLASDELGSVITETELIFEVQAHHGLKIDIGGVKEISGNATAHDAQGRAKAGLEA